MGYYNRLYDEFIYSFGYRISVIRCIYRVKLLITLDISAKTDTENSTYGLTGYLILGGV